MTREPLLTVEQCAERLNCHHGRVRRLIYAGKLTASKIGSGWRVDPEQLEAYIVSQRNVQPDAPSLADSGLPDIANPRFQ